MVTKAYPASCDERADLRVLRALATEWETLIQRRSDMARKGWRLLKVANEGEGIVAVLGRPKSSTPSSGVAQ